MINQSTHACIKIMFIISFKNIIFLISTIHLSQLRIMTLAIDVLNFNQSEVVKCLCQFLYFFFGYMPISIYIFHIFCLKIKFHGVI